MCSSSPSRRSFVLVCTLAACSSKSTSTPPPPPLPPHNHAKPEPGASFVAETLTAASSRIRSAVGQGRDKLTVTESSQMMAAWAAVETAAKLSVRWKERAGGPVAPKLVAGVERLSGDLSKLLATSDAEVGPRAVAVYSDARAVSQLFAVAGPAPAHTSLPAVTAAACKAAADDVIADLGGIATSEIMLGSTRPGYPWLTLSANEIISRADPSLIRPAWVHVPAADATVAHAKVTSWFLGDAAKAHRAITMFDGARHAGFESPAALQLARSIDSPELLTAMSGAVKKQIGTAAAAPAGAPSDFAQVSSLVDGLKTGARARAAALAAGKPIGVTHDLAPTARDRTVALHRRELEACALLPGADAARATTALTMMEAFGSPGASCTAGHNDCEPGTTCSAGLCVPWCGGCAAGDTCNEGRCTFPSYTCQANADCVLYPGTTCTGGECVQTCGASTCGRDQICTLTCVPRPLCGVCTVGQYCDGDTPSGCTTGPAQRQCTTDANCKPPISVPSQGTPRCVAVANDNGTPINMCIGIGWACTNANDCGPGTECDKSIGQCVDRETYTCNATNTCRSAEKCVAAGAGAAQRCEVQIPALGQPCDATGAGGALVYGECRKGTWQDAGHGAQKCVPGSPNLETCDGLDNNCDGTPDNDVPSHTCTANARGVCANGHSTCVAGSERCVPGKPADEICDNQDNDCNGITDDIQPKPCTASAPGDCANGTTACSGGQQVCNRGPANGEVCDGRDNDCNDVVDDLKTTHDAPVTDTTWSGWQAFGMSINLVFGTADCGGNRVSANATKVSGGNSHCEVVDWADIVCQNPDQKIGNFTAREACNNFFGQGGQAGNNSHDCRYIVHVGTWSTDGITCQGSHVVNVPTTCN